MQLFEKGEITEIAEVFEPWFAGKKYTKWTEAEMALVGENLPNNDKVKQEMDRIKMAWVSFRQEEKLQRMKTKL